MEYNVYEPSHDLSAYVKLYWTLEGEATHPPVRERIFPDGCIELVFHYGDVFKKYNKDGFDIQPGGLVHGQLKKFMEIEPTGRIGIFSVRFLPHGFKPFVTFNVDEITERVIGLNEAWGEDGLALQERVVAAASNTERIQLLETFLQSKRIEKNDVTAEAVTHIQQASGMISIENLASDLCMGKRHFERKFSETVGLSPKLFARIIRFNHVLKLIERKEWNSLTHIAQEGGFYDQAHFIKDFRDFTGLNPKSYFAEDLELVKFFNL